MVPIIFLYLNYVVQFLNQNLSATTLANVVLKILDNTDRLHLEEWRKCMQATRCFSQVAQLATFRFVVISTNLYHNCS